VVVTVVAAAVMMALSLSCVTATAARHAYVEIGIGTSAVWIDILKSRRDVHKLDPRINVGDGIIRSSGGTSGEIHLVFGLLSLF
jgi:hypothetical protein